MTRLSDDVEQAELEAFVPGAYDPCRCVSGKKFKFCCQKAFIDITLAMCAAEEGDFNKAMHHMQEAESKVGRTAEIVCRYAICWSFFDKAKSNAYLEEAREINPNHPRLNYLLGVEAVESKNYRLAIEYYLKALEHYPKHNKYYLNETLTNLGTAYFELQRYAEAKDAWEKALIALPTDGMVANNLYNFIYGNENVPNNLREVSPFIIKYLEKYAERFNK